MNPEGPQLKNKAHPRRRLLATALSWLRPLLSRASRSAVMRRTFRHIYHRGMWEGSESASGYGSDFENTARVRQIVPELVELLQVETFLDAPCGDYNWMRHVDLKEAYYIGVDIVSEIIARNQSLFADAHHRFIVGDVTRADLPDADLILCRDCLVHLPTRDALRAIDNFKSTGRYLLVTTFPGAPVNRDIVTGGWRPLNLELSPFRFPPPIRCDLEGDPSGNEIWKTKSLGLWRSGDLP